MKNNRKVRIAWTNKTVTFTQRGQSAKRGFIRLNGKIITGTMADFGIEKVFYPGGQNNNLPYAGDSASW